MNAKAFLPNQENGVTHSQNSITDRQLMIVRVCVCVCVGVWGGGTIKIPYCARNGIFGKKTCYFPSLKTFSHSRDGATLQNQRQHNIT